MSEKLSKLFHEFVYENDCNGNEEIIAETNEFVAGEDIEAGTMLDDRLGEKYFYKCMDLAENVIKSFEDEQPPLNDNQQIVLEQLCLIYIKQIYKSSLQAVYIFIKNGMSDAYLNLDRKEASQVLEVFSKWAQEQEDK